jgi:hypothetical protein
MSSKLLAANCTTETLGAVDRTVEHCARRVGKSPRQTPQLRAIARESGAAIIAEHTLAIGEQRALVGDAVRSTHLHRGSVQSINRPVDKWRAVQLSQCTSRKASNDTESFVPQR